jgi:hypothetical protein
VYCLSLRSPHDFPGFISLHLQMSGDLEEIGYHQPPVSIKYLYG